MTFNEIEKIFRNYKKGSFKKIEWERNLKLKDGRTFTKRTSTTARFLINYANIKTVKDRLAEREAASEIREIKPTEWLIKNLVKITETGKVVLVVFTSAKHKSNSKYYDQDGKEVQVKDIVDQMYAKDKPKSGTHKAEQFYLSLENIIKL